MVGPRPPHLFLSVSGFPSNALFDEIPVEQKNGSYRGPIGQKKLGDVLDFAYIFKIRYGIFGVYIFPKWLKKVPGHIPILFK